MGFQPPKWENHLAMLGFTFSHLWKCVWILKHFLNSFPFSCLSLGCKPKVGSWQCWLITHAIIIRKMTSQKTKWQLPKFVNQGFYPMTITCHNCKSISNTLPTHNNLGVVMVACTTTSQVLGISCVRIKDYINVANR